MVQQDLMGIEVKKNEKKHPKDLKIIRKIKDKKLINIEQIIKKS